MRILISVFVLLCSLSPALAQLKAKNFPNLVVFQPDATDPYLEVWYTASFRKLESGIQAKFLGEQNKSLDLKNDSNTYILEGIMQPLLTGSRYTLKMEIVENVKWGKLIRIRFSNDEPSFNMLNPQMGIFRTLAGEVQDIIDRELEVEYYSEDQSANTMYLFTPAEIEKNLSSYLFMYSKEPMDTTMKKLSEWLVLSTEKPQPGRWLNDSTFRVDGLRQARFGTNESFSLTIVHSMVQGDYHQYEIYLSNYIGPGNENNYQVRPYDLHKRLWRFYNTLLFMEKSGR